MNLLIIFDMQEGFRYENVEKLIPNINKLINKINKYIIFTVFDNKKNSFFEKQLNWKKFENIVLRRSY